MSTAILSEVLRAEQRIRPHIRETPLDPSPILSELGGANVWVKLENLQYTGSFKLRGATNKVLSLTAEERAAGVVTASSGNHGAAVAYSLQKLGASGTIFVPEIVSPAKETMIRRYGAQIRKIGNDSAISEAEARIYAEKQGLVYISPYNDPQVIGGQGTIGVEIGRQLRPQPLPSPPLLREGTVTGDVTNVDLSVTIPSLRVPSGRGGLGRGPAVFISLGGGGLISGIATYLKTLDPTVQIIACSPTNSAVMQHSVAAGRIIDEESLDTLSDGTAGGVEPGAITFELVRDLVDSYVDVAEDEIAAAMRLFMEHHHMMIEGSAGVAIAGYLRLKEQFVGRDVVIVICGANISLAKLTTVLTK